MIIQEEIKSVTHPEENGIKVLLEAPLRNSTYFTKLDRTADGGYRFISTNTDEFDNEFKFTVVLDREDVEEFKRLVQIGLL